MTATEKTETAEAYIKSEIITTGEVLGGDSLISNKAEYSGVNSITRPAFGNHHSV